MGLQVDGFNNEDEDLISIVRDLLQKLTDKLNSSSERVNHLLNTTKEVTEEKKTSHINDNYLSKDSRSVRVDVQNNERVDNTARNNIQSEIPTDQDQFDQEVIRRLERERLELVMHIQRQDFLECQLKNLLRDNESTVDMALRYLRENDGRKKGEIQESKRNVRLHNDVIVSPITENLDVNLKAMHHGLSLAQNIIQDIHHNIDADFNRLQSQKYEEELQELVRSLNYAFQKYDQIETKVTKNHTSQSLG